MTAFISPWRIRFRDAYGVLPGRWERERLLLKCQIKGECWIWTGDDTIDVDGRKYDYRRVAYLFLRGPIPDKHFVGTSCGRDCCMPEHMYCFTQSSTRRRSECGSEKMRWL